MNEANRKIIWKLITSTGDRMKDKLPESKFHPKGRNPYAHILLLVKTKFGCSYKDIDDDKIETLKRFVSYDQSPNEIKNKLEQLRALDNNIKINVALAKSSTIGVDTEEDFVAIKKIMEYK